MLIFKKCINLKSGIVKKKREILKETRLGVFLNNGVRITDTAEIKRYYEDISHFVHFT